MLWELRSRATEARVRVDTTVVLTVYLLLLTCIPSRLVLAPLGAAGTPAQMLGMLLLLWYVADRLSRLGHDRDRARSTVHPALYLFVAACLASYYVAMTRPAAAVEVRAADRGLLTLSAWAGVLLLAADGISSLARLETLLRRLVTVVGGVALLGLFQFATGQAWVDRLSIPGLSLNADVVGVFGRVGFTRPAGTAIHPIEFGVVLTMVLPLALHYAFRDANRSRWWHWAAPAMIALAVPLSISRSAVLGGLVGVLVMLPAWSPARRRQAYALMALLAGTVYVSVPGLLGALRGLFLGIGQDDSAASRTDSYAIVWDFVTRDPVLGRGIGTFLPAYRILDNEYLGTVIETGFVGLVALLSLLGAGLLTARQVRRVSSDRHARDLAQALAAGIAAGGCSLATFDGLSFPMCAGMLFLLLGCVTALHRLVTATPAVELRAVGCPIPQLPTQPGPAVAVEKRDSATRD